MFINIADSCSKISINVINAKLTRCTVCVFHFEGLLETLYSTQSREMYNNSQAESLAENDHTTPQPVCEASSTGIKPFVFSRVHFLFAKLNFQSCEQKFQCRGIHKCKDTQTQMSVLNSLFLVLESFHEKLNLSGIHHDRLAHLCKCGIYF